jgi:hypothetical protein
MLAEFLNPQGENLPPVGQIQPTTASPRLSQAIVFFRVVAIGGNPRDDLRARTCRIEIEAAAKGIKDVAGCVPLNLSISFVHSQIVDAH